MQETISKKLKEINKDIILKDVTWKRLIYCIEKGKNIMLLGDSGTGKTSTVDALFELYSDRKKYSIPLGSTDDAKSVLLGNMQGNNKDGTFLNRSNFITAIQTPNAIIHLDEISRGHKSAWNILMSATDPKQRYVVLDEEIGHPIIKVADGVVFIATANVGIEYTATQLMDKALKRRFKIIYMKLMDFETEFNFLKDKFPMVDHQDIFKIVDIANETRNDYNSNDPKLSDYISTHYTTECCEQLSDGFDFEFAIETEFYPLYEHDEDELEFFKKIIKSKC